MMFNQNTADCVIFFYHISSFIESRPLSIPMKVMPDTTVGESWTSSEERMKELIAHAWDAVKRLTVQVLNYTILLLMCLYIEPSTQDAYFFCWWFLDGYLLYCSSVSDMQDFTVSSSAHCIDIIAVRFFEICHPHSHNFWLCGTYIILAQPSLALSMVVAMCLPGTSVD